MNISCCDSTLLPGGTYNRGNNPAHPATLSPFRLDTYEVTVGRFRAFVNAGQGTRESVIASGLEPGAGAHPRIPGTGWVTAWTSTLAPDTAMLGLSLKCSETLQTWTDTAGPNEQRPMNCITWYEAFLFCLWDGGYLPTEAELNYAAAGGDDQREYPWGSGLDHSHAVYGCDARESPDCSLADVPPVGSRSPLGDGRWGQSDLAGSVWEWTLDWYNDAYIDPCVDCAVTAPAGSRMVSGGSFFDDNLSLSVGKRLNLDPRRWSDVGARCARNP